MTNTYKDLLLSKKEEDKDNQYMLNTYKELLQHIFLYELSTTGFFDIVAFHGGTCLRIVDKIDRFSEDLDFVLKKKTESKVIASFLDQAGEKCSKKGLNFEIKHKNINTQVQKVFINEQEIAKEFLSEDPKFSHPNKKVKIKIEIDLTPPEGSTYEDAEIKFPTSFNMSIQGHDSSFSGKLHAVLCREFNSAKDGQPGNVKGRDFFDLHWYLEKGVEPNYELLKNALLMSGPFAKTEFSCDKSWLFEKLKDRINTVNWDIVRKDMEPFLLSMDYDSLEKMLSHKEMSRVLESWNELEIATL